MSNTLFNNHPLIKNANQYFVEKKYISISSEDRDITKYPNASEFEITLPQEYLNVSQARLYSWSFPSNYDVFSAGQYNITMTFKFITLYNPGEHDYSDPLTEAIFAALYSVLNKNILISIEPGFYNPDQMATELTNKFNEAVTHIIDNFFLSPEGLPYAEAAKLFTNYDRFQIVYNSVSQKLWFGNTADQFILTNDSQLLVEALVVNNNCLRKNTLPGWDDWGLSAYLGFTRCNATALSGQELINNLDTNTHTGIFHGEIVPRFYYGDAIPNSGDDGYWLLPTLPGATVYFLQAPLKIAFMGPSYMYMEIEGMNCIDETKPYNLSKYTMINNITNSVVNSSFAKIPVPTTPISQWYDAEMRPYKYWSPPAERISKLKVKFRYHNGSLVQFGSFAYSFMIEFTILQPQQEKTFNIVNTFA